MATSTKRCLVAGCNAPRALNKHGQPAPHLRMCTDHMRQYWRGELRAQTVAPIAKPQPAMLCCVDGCTEPRLTTTKMRYCRCAQHQREQWASNHPRSDRQRGRPRTAQPKPTRAPRPTVRPYQQMRGNHD